MAVPSNIDEIKSLQFWKSVVLELVATLFYVFFVARGGGALGAETVQGGLMLGFAVASLLWVFNGAHFNPAITVGYLLARRISLARAVFFVGVQMVGGIVGCYLWKGLSGAAPEALAFGKTIKADQAFGTELFTTLFFAVAFFATCDASRKDHSGNGSLAIGITGAIAFFLSHGISRCGLNPARAFGGAVATQFDSNHWVYWAGPMIGALVAALVYEFLLMENASVLKFRAYFTWGYDPDCPELPAPAPSEEKAAEEAEAAPVENGKDGEATELQETKTES